MALPSIPSRVTVARGVVAVAAAVLVCLLPLLAACTGHSSGDSTTRSAAAATLTEAEIRYGVSPTRNSQVTYQDGVIIMEHGAEAIRSQSSNGLVWTIDASAPGASDIQRDKILFATGRVVGRVLAAERRGNSLAVTLGPVELTDVIQEAHISYHGTLDPDAMITYVAPDYPGTFTDLDAPEQASAAQSGAQHLRSAVWTDGDQAHVRVMPAADLTSDKTGPSGSGSGVPADIPIKEMHFLPSVRDGLGVKETFNKDGMKFIASAKLIFDNPSFSFNLDISKGHLNTAAVEMSGVGGVEVTFQGGTNGEFKNINEAFELPIDVSLPIGGIGVPFAATFHQSVLIQTLFTVKQAVMKASGNYRIGGTIKAGIVNGTLSATAPVFMSITENLVNSLSGVSLGVNGLVLGYGGKLIVGLGSFGFVVGPYMSVNNTIGITRGSDTQTAMVGYTCRSAELKIWLDYGVGYAIPNTVVKALNTFLSLFHAPTINASHGTSLGTASIYQSSEGLPPSCATAAP